KDLCNLRDQADSSHRNVIKASKERRNICSARSCRQKSLIRGEYQCDICLDSLSCKDFHRLKSFHCHGDLNNHVRMDLRDLSSLFYHALRVGCCSFHLSADRSVNDGCDLCDYLLKYTAFLGNERWVCRNPTDHPHIIRLSNILYICCVDKEFHFVFLLKYKSAYCCLDYIG